MGGPGGGEGSGLPSPYNLEQRSHLGQEELPLCTAFLGQNWPKLYRPVFLEGIANGRPPVGLK